MSIRPETINAFNNFQKEYNKNGKQIIRNNKKPLPKEDDKDKAVCDASLCKNHTSSSGKGGKSNKKKLNWHDTGRTFKGMKIYTPYGE